MFSSNPKPVFVENKYSVLDYDSMPDQRRVYPIRFNKECRNKVKNDNKSCHFNKKKYSSNDKNRRKKNQYYQEKSFISVNHKSGNLDKTFVKDFTKKSWNRQGMVPRRQDKKNIVSKKKICDSLKVKHFMLNEQVKPELFMKIKSVHKELNKLVRKKNPVRVMSSDVSNICQDCSLQALVSLLDNLMNAGLSNRAWKEYLCKWCLYTGNSFH